MKEMKIKSMLSIRDRAQNTESILRRQHCPALVHLCRAGIVPEHRGHRDEWGDTLALTGLSIHCERPPADKLKKAQSQHRQEKLVKMGGENKNGLLVMQLQKGTI